MRRFLWFTETAFSCGGNESSFLTFKLVSQLYESHVMLESFGNFIKNHFS